MTTPTGSDSAAIKRFVDYWYLKEEPDRDEDYEKGVMAQELKALIAAVLTQLEKQANTYTTVLQGYEAKLELVPLEAIQKVRDSL